MRGNLLRHFDLWQASLKIASLLRDALEGLPCSTRDGVRDAVSGATGCACRNSRISGHDRCPVAKIPRLQFFYRNTIDDRELSGPVLDRVANPAARASDSSSALSIKQSSRSRSTTTSMSQSDWIIRRKPRRRPDNCRSNARFPGNRWKLQCTGPMILGNRMRSKVSIEASSTRISTWLRGISDAAAKWALPPRSADLRHQTDPRSIDRQAVRPPP